MQQKLLKLAKMLKRFSVLEVQSMLEVEDDEIKKAIKILEKSGHIKKVAINEYAYLKIPASVNYNTEFNKQKQEKDLVIQKNPQKLFTKKEERAVYENAPGYAKPYLVKYYTVLCLAKNLQGEQLRIFLKQFSKEHPKYKMSPSTFLRLKRRYLEGGLKSLIPRYSNVRKNYSSVPPEMYKEFKKLYLTQYKLSADECIRKLAKKFDPSLIPSCMSFRRLLYKEYSKGAITKMREIPMELPELIFKIEPPKINDKYPKFENYIDGEKEFLKYLESKDNEAAVSQKTHVKKHVHPFFKNYKFKDITQEVIIEFQNLKLAQGYSISSVSRFIGALSSIYNRHSNYTNDIQFSTNNSLAPNTNNKILSEDEIKAIIENNDYELWILAAGISPAELDALEYSDIDFKNKTVSINKMCVDGVMCIPRKNISSVLYLCRR